MAAAGFKFYIHDTGQAFSLELFGSFMDASVKELICCWETAKGTLKGQRVVLDLRGVQAIDEAARQWLATMAQDGAHFLPETFLLDSLGGVKFTPADRSDAKPGLFVRLFRFHPKPAR